MKADFFANNQTIIWRSYSGERRLHFSKFHQLIALLSCVFIAGFVLFSLSNLVVRGFAPSTAAELNGELRHEFETRVENLAAERDSLRIALRDSQETASKLIQNLGAQQDLLFAYEKEKYELSANLESMREQMVSAQSRLDVLGLRLEAQTEQLVAIQEGRPVADGSTLTSITTALAETAQARDEARAEVQKLREEIAITAQRSANDQRKRDILIAQLEEAIELSLVPMKSTLNNTGVNVDQILQNVRANYSGIGGLSIEADLAVFSDSPEGIARVEKLIQDMDELSQLSFAVQTMPLGQPLKASYRLSSPYGYRRHPISGRTKMHTGVDMAAPTGTPIYSTGIGTVVTAGWKTGYGKTVIIRHENGMETLYGHMSRIRVNVGEQIKLGQRIGDVGSTGQSTGPHLHYEVRVNGDPKNPMNFLRASNYVQ